MKQRAIPIVPAEKRPPPVNPSVALIVFRTVKRGKQGLRKQKLYMWKATSAVVISFTP